jgi:hypothetical protein
LNIQHQDEKCLYVISKLLNWSGSAQTAVTFVKAWKSKNIFSLQYDKEILLVMLKMVSEHFHLNFQVSLPSLISTNSCTTAPEVASRLLSGGHNL